MPFLTLWFNSGFVILGLMTALWLLSLAIKNSSIVDIFWGMGFVITFWVGALFVRGELTTRAILLGVITTTWGIRLSLYIFQRNHGKPEDFRYAKWRQEAGDAWWWQSFFKVFILQCVLMWMIAILLLAMQTSRASDSALACYDLIAFIIWLTGLAFEAGGDYQLARFKANPANKGKLLNTGFWSVTRHPNYWGDAVQWWAFYLLAFISGAWWTIFSPFIMTYLLRNVSGVTLLEKTLKETKPGYAEYIANTPAFFPRILPRKKR
jgi:steroid 5-alpha reductase family enzyme